MITFSKGSLFLGQHEALVCPVNCLGPMGKGLAVDFRKRFPYHSKVYQEMARDGGIGIGTMLTVSGGPDRPQAIVFFPTKNDWRNPSLLEYITEGLDALATEIQQRQFQSIGIPALGCGQGGLPWHNVAPEISKRLAHLNCAITVYEPK